MTLFRLIDYLTKTYGIKQMFVQFLTKVAVYWTGVVGIHCFSDARATLQFFCVISSCVSWHKGLRFGRLFAKLCSSCVFTEHLRLVSLVRLTADIKFEFSEKLTL